MNHHEMALELFDKVSSEIDLDDKAYEHKVNSLICLGRYSEAEDILKSQPMTTEALVTLVLIKLFQKEDCNEIIQNIIETFDGYSLKKSLLKLLPQYRRKVLDLLVKQSGRSETFIHFRSLIIIDWKLQTC